MEDRLIDKIQPVLIRFKLRSCNLLIVEQTWLGWLLHHIRRLIQHRGGR